MKDLFKKVFSQKTSSPIFVGFGAFAIFTFIVFPGLNSANTSLNIFSALVGIFSLVFLYYYIKMDKFIDELMNLEPGETELDYVNPDEIKPKRKRTTKAKPPVVKVTLKNKTK